MRENLFKNVRLYAVTDLKSSDPRVLDTIDACYAGGADAVQIRSKILSDRDLYNFGIQCRKIADVYHKYLIVNDRLDLAVAINADGIHVGQEDLPVAVIRSLCRVPNRPFIVGKSTHSFEQAQQAAAEDIDYFGVGPVFPTPTKKGYVPVGLELIRKVSGSNFLVPFVAIGGLNEDNIDSVIHAGARCIAVVRVLFESEDPYETARNLRSKIESKVSSHA